MPTTRTLATVLATVPVFRRTRSAPHPTPTAADATATATDATATDDTGDAGTATAPTVAAVRRTLAASLPAAPALRRTVAITLATEPARVAEGARLAMAAATVATWLAVANPRLRAAVATAALIGSTWATHRVRASVTPVATLDGCGIVHDHQP